MTWDEVLITGVHCRAASWPARRAIRRGVSVRLDDPSRELLAGGELDTLIKERHVVGVTTNPTIFASALSKATGTPISSSPPG